MTGIIASPVPAAGKYIDTPDGYPLRDYPAIIPVSDETKLQACRDQVTPPKSTSWMYSLCTVMLIFDITFFSLLLITTIDLVVTGEPPSIFFAHLLNSDRLPSKRVRRLVKRLPPGSVDGDHIVLGILMGGMGLALVFGIATSWVIQRKQFGPTKKRNGQSDEEGVWTWGYNRLAA